jgi:hypothetical protein
MSLEHPSLMLSAVAPRKMKRHILIKSYSSSPEKSGWKFECNPRAVCHAKTVF